MSDNGASVPDRAVVPSGSSQQAVSPVPASIPSAGAVEIVDLKGFLDALGAALKPAFDEERAAWEKEGPGAQARAAGMGITISGIGGNCPVQADGEFDGNQFYFRARGDEWQFHVGPDEGRFGPDEWVIERDYGSGFDAGWMHRHEAINFICDGVNEYRAAQAIETQSAKTAGLGPQDESAVATPCAQGAVE